MRLIPLASLLLVASLVLGGCGGGGVENGPEAVDPALHVDAGRGSDIAGDGSSDLPFRTITKALTLAGPGDVVRVHAGTYDEALGEVFPLLPAPGVTIQGTIVPVVGGVQPRTKVVGGGTWPDDPEQRLNGTIVPSDDVRLFGLALMNPVPFGPFDGPKPGAIVLAAAGVEVVSCRLHDSDRGVRMVAGARDALLSNLNVHDNVIGIFVSEPGEGNRIEGSDILGNGTGVMVFAEGVDFGGGPAGSLGGNAFAENDTNDFVHFTADTVTTHAENCLWASDPIEKATGSPPSIIDADLWEAFGTVVTTGAGVFAPFPGPIATN